MVTKAEFQAGMLDYVTDPHSNGFQNQADATCSLTMTHSNLKAVFPEIRVDKHITIGDLKVKMNKHCGTGTTFMRLFLKDPTGRTICEMNDDSKMLGYYSPGNGYIAHIQDDDPHSLSKGGGLEDVSLVEKYEISEEDYMKREDNFRNFKAKKLAADPDWTWEKECNKNNPDWKPREKITDDDFQGDEARAISVGDRCEVSGGRRGEVAYVGKVEGLPKGWWIGIRYDEPVGKGDGTVAGKRYFESAPKYGGMLRPQLVAVGDYPEEDLFSDSEDEI